MTEVLVKTGKHTVTALTRTGSQSPLPSGITKIYVDYDNEASLVSALRGQEFLIISLAVAARPGTEALIMAAAAKAGVPWVMPTCYGTDIENKALMAENLTGRGVFANIDAAERNGLSWTTMNCSFWYEYSLSMGPTCYGFDIANQSATFFDDGTTAISTSTWLQCGRAAAAFLSLKVLPEDEDDEATPTMARWRNRPLFVSSFRASQRNMLDSLHRVLGTTDGDWRIEEVDAAARYKEATALLGTARGHQGFQTCLYTRTFYKDGGGDFERKTANKALGLPVEDIDEATGRAVELAKVTEAGSYGEGTHVGR